MADQTEAFGQQTPQTPASDYSALVFVFKQLAARLATCALVQVKSVTNEGGLSPVGFVDVQVLVNQMTGNRIAVPHGIIYGIPYFRLQGGTNAIILDPQVDDIGMCAFCSRDISAVKADPAAAIANANAGKGGANPGSFRSYDWADGLYLGGFLNGTPEQFVQFSSDGITIKSPTLVTIEAPMIKLKGPIEQTAGHVSLAGNVHGDGTAVFDGNVTGASISLSTHTHGGVTPGGSNTAPPNP